MTTAAFNPLPYIGRFAPSPTGPLHFGSLLAALASYLDAKAHGGQWLVRMEDLDPPREQAGAADSILSALAAHHLYWDGSVLYQSQRLAAYREALERLEQYSYRCNCTRTRLAGLQGQYDGHCLRAPPADDDLTAIRLRIDQLGGSQLQAAENFHDLFLGQQQLPLRNHGDFIVVRKDKLFAYQLAVSVDDSYQGITHVIRGFDLLESTSRQRYVLAILGQALPFYGHTPLALGQDGDKLSKQTQAPPISNAHAFDNLVAALIFLGQPVPNELHSAKDIDALLAWASANWSRSTVPTLNALAPTQI